MPPMPSSVVSSSCSFIFTSKMPDAKPTYIRMHFSGGGVAVFFLLVAGKFVRALVKLSIYYSGNPIWSMIPFSLASSAKK
jgi:hypothetical protein